MDTQGPINATEVHEASKNSKIRAASGWIHEIGGEDVLSRFRYSCGCCEKVPTKSCGWHRCQRNAREGLRELVRTGALALHRLLGERVTGLERKPPPRCRRQN